MSICNRCERFFVYKNSLRRHQQKRRRPCRPAVASCMQCGNKFTSFESLKKHKKLYCKGEEQQHRVETNLQDFLNQLPSPHNKHDDDDLHHHHHHQQHHQLCTPQSVADDFTPASNNYFHNNSLQVQQHHQLYTPQSVADFTPVPNNYSHNDSLQELLNQINFSPMISNNNNTKEEEEEEEEEEDESNIHTAVAAAATAINDYDDNIVNVDNDNDDSNVNEDKLQQNNQEVLNHFDNILTSWLCEIQRLENVCKSNSIVKDKILESLYHMLQDGLLSTIEYNDLVYTSNLFIKLHDLITVYSPAIHKRSVIDILTELYEMKKITRDVLIEMCVNL